jgi:hypothetical protein
VTVHRRFTHSHLAQLKYIMPEAIVINKILLRDDTTCCMYPDLQVNLLVSAVENVVKQKGETAYLALRRVFRQRLVEFYREHPEVRKSFYASHFVTASSEVQACFSNQMKIIIMLPLLLISGR